MDQPSHQPSPEAMESAELMARLYAIVDARMAVFMPQILELLGPALVQGRVNHHHLIRLFENVAGAAAAADRRYVSKCLRDNVDGYAKAVAEKGLTLPPIQPVPPEVTELLQGVADRFKDFCAT